MHDATEEAAALAHASLFVLHALSAFWNYRKAGGIDRYVAFHTVAATVDAYAVHIHLQRVKEGA